MATQRHSFFRRQLRMGRRAELVRVCGNYESTRAIGLTMKIDCRAVRIFKRAGTFPK